MIKPGAIVTKIEITKSDNCGEDTGVEGYDIKVSFFDGNDICYTKYSIPELENKPRGIYSFDGENYIQIENWE